MGSIALRNDEGSDEYGGKVVQLKTNQEIHANGVAHPSKKLLGLLAKWIQPPMGSVMEDRSLLGNVSAAAGFCNDHHPTFAYWRNGEIIGLMFMRNEGNMDVWRIGELAVDPDHRGHGVGAALVREAVSRYPRLDAVVQDEALVKWYANLGMTFSAPIPEHEDQAPWPEWSVSTIPQAEVQKVFKLPGQEGAKYAFTHPFLKTGAVNAALRPVIGSKRLAGAYQHMHQCARKEAKQEASITLSEVVLAVKAGRQQTMRMMEERGLMSGFSPERAKEIAEITMGLMDGPRALDFALALKELGDSLLTPKGVTQWIAK